MGDRGTGPADRMPVATSQRVTGVPDGRQARAAHASHAPRAFSVAARVIAACVISAGLGGCGQQSSYSPIDWWHGMQGGPIAGSRPPPPNADAPYPSLGSVPDRPAPPDSKAQAGIARGLAADRANALYANSSDPLTPPPAAPARPVPPPAPAGDPAEQSNASLEAAQSHRAAPAPAAPAPLAMKLAEAAAAPVPAAAAAGAETEMPAVPPEPPPPPSLAGVRLPAGPPTPAPVAPAPAPAPARAEEAVPIPFAAGSATLPQEALKPLRALVQRRGDAGIAVTGFGGAITSETAAQAAALPLGLARARAVAADLAALGVPAARIRIAAEPAGNGASARIVNW